MIEINWKTLLPEKQNNFSGSKISLYFLILWGSIGTVREFFQTHPNHPSRSDWQLHYGSAGAGDVGIVDDLKW